MNDKYQETIQHEINNIIAVQRADSILLQLTIAKISMQSSDWREYLCIMVEDAERAVANYEFTSGLSNEFLRDKMLIEVRRRVEEVHLAIDKYEASSKRG